MRGMVRRGVKEGGLAFPSNQDLQGPQRDIAAAAAAVRNHAANAKIVVQDLNHRSHMNFVSLSIDVVDNQVVGSLKRSAFKVSQGPANRFKRRQIDAVEDLKAVQADRGLQHDRS